MQNVRVVTAQFVPNNKDILFSYVLNCHIKIFPKLNL